MHPQQVSDDTKLCGVDILEGRDVIQCDLDRLERGVCAELMKFNKDKYKVLYIDQGISCTKHRLEGERREISPEEKDLGVLVIEKLSRSQQCICSSESQLCPGLHQRKCDQQVKGSDSLPLLCSCDTLTWSAVSSPQYKKDMELLEQDQRRTTKVTKGLEYHSCRDTLRGLGFSM